MQQSCGECCTSDVWTEFGFSVCHNQLFSEFILKCRSCEIANQASKANWGKGDFFFSFFSSQLRFQNYG